MKKNLVIAFIALLLFAVPSFADTITFTLDNNTSSGNSCTNCGPFGTVTVNQLTANSVQVTETLASGVGFVNTGAGLSLQFNISGSPAITISNLTSGFSQVSPVSKGDFGTFSYAIDCGSLCGNGGNNPYYGTLSFTVTSRRRPLLVGLKEAV